MKKPRKIQPLKRYEVRFAGQGGQGVVLAGVFLAQAGLNTFEFVTNSAAYGPEARGSWTTSDTIFSDEFVPFPRIEHPNFFIAMSQEGYDRNIEAVAPDALVLCDATLVHPRRNNCILLPASQACLEHIGNKNSANVFFLGSLCELTDLVPAAQILKLLEGKHGEQNIKAFELGVKMVKDFSS